MVFGETIGGDADGADALGGQVFAAGDVIDDAIFQGIEEHAVDGEIASAGVFFRGSEADAAGAAAVFVFSISAEGGDFNDAFGAADEDDAEGGADGLGGGEKRADAVGGCVGGDVPILGDQTEEGVADASTGEICDVAGIAQALEDGQGVRIGSNHVAWGLYRKGGRFC